MNGRRQDVLGWKTLRDGRLGIVVKGPDGKAKGGRYVTIGSSGSVFVVPDKVVKVLMARIVR